MSTTTGKAVWIGRVISVLGALPFVFGAVMKLKGGPEVAEGMEHLGLPASLVLPLAVLELACVVLYLVPVTSVLGAILLSGYLGGAILAHLRVGDPFYAQIVIGISLWLGLYLRDARLRSLLPRMAP